MVYSSPSNQRDPVFGITGSRGNACQRLFIPSSLILWKGKRGCALGGITRTSSNTSNDLQRWTDDNCCILDSEQVMVGNRTSKRTWLRLTLMPANINLSASVHTNPRSRSRPVQLNAWVSRFTIVINCFLYGYTFIDPVFDVNVEEAVLFYIIPLIS